MPVSTAPAPRGSGASRLLAVAACLALVAPPAALADKQVAPRHDRTSPAVQRGAENAGSGMVEVIVAYESRPDPAERARIRDLGGHAGRQFNVI